MATTNIQTFSGDVEVAGALTVTGTLTSTTGVDTVALAADATDTSRPIIFSTGTTGSQSLKTDAGITYNPFTNTLSVAGGIDNVVLATDANDASRPIIFSTGTTGSQPLKTDAGITYNPFTNTLSVAGGIDNVVLATDANDASRPIIFSTGTTGSQPLKTDAGITYNPSTNKLSVTGGLSTSISPGDYLTGTAYDGSTARTFDVDATSANTASKVVARDASGNFSAGTITAALTGNADTATTLQTARNINGVSFDGSTEITVTANTPNTLTRGDYLTGSNFNGATATTWEVDATSANTASKVVARDASGNFNAGTITAALSGNASTATKVYVTSRDNTNETHYPTFTSTHVDGNTSLYQDAGFTYNPSSGTLTSTTFSGALSGNASTASQVNVTSRDSVDASHYPTFTTTDADGNTDLYQDAGFYYNPSSGTLTSTTFAGALSGNASTASQVNVTSRDSTDAVHYPTFTTTHANGNTSLYQDLGFTYNPSTGTLTSTTFSGALSGNATTATTAENQSGGTVSATSGTFSGDISFTDSGTTKRGIQGTVATNDFWFVGGGATASNAGFMEIATGDDAGTEPIYARQYSGTPLTGTAVRTLTLLDGSGNSSFPGTVTATNGFTGDVTGNADTATQVYVTSRDSTDASHYPTFTTTDGDGNTSLYQDAGFYYNPSTGTLTSTVFSGTNGIFSGNVGVGTTSPGIPLHVSSANFISDTAGPAASANNVVRFSTTEADSTLLFGLSDTASYISSFDKSTFATERNLILNANGGNVGIGKTNPSRSLHIYRDKSYVSGGTHNNSAFEIQQQLGTDDYIYNGQHRAQFRINSGLGTYSNRSLELALLDNGMGVIQANAASEGYFPLSLNPGGNINAPVLVNSLTPSGHNFLVQGNAYVSSNLTVSGLLHVDAAATGRIGIGTTIPQEKLHIYDADTNEAAIRLDNGTSQHRIRQKTSEATLQIESYPNASSGDYFRWITWNSAGTDWDYRLSMGHNGTVIVNGDFHCASRFVRNSDLRFVTGGYTPAYIGDGRFVVGFDSIGGGYCDTIGLNTYTDSSGGDTNSLVFYKNSIAARMYQQTYASSSGFSTYKDFDMTTPSDDRLKDNEEYIRNATDTLLKLKPQVYDLKLTLSSNVYERAAGVMVQDVWYDAPELRFMVKPGYLSQIPKEAPRRSDDPRDDPDYSKWGEEHAKLEYNFFIPYIIKSIQEIHTELTKTKTQVHDITPSNLNDYRGMLVSADTNEFKNNTPKLSLTKKPYDKKCFGVVSCSNTYSIDNEILINTNGVGEVWVINHSNLESGDYLTSSNVPGYAMKQNDDILHNYTVAKSTMDCDFSPNQVVKKRVKQELANVTYYVKETLTEISKEKYDTIEDEYYKKSGERSLYIKYDYEKTDDTVDYDKLEYANSSGKVLSLDEWSVLESSLQSDYKPRYLKNKITRISIEEYSKLDDLEKSLYEMITEIVYYYKYSEKSKNPLPKYTIEEIEQEYVNILDENGQLQWEDTDEMEPAYKIRYLTADGTQTDEANAVHIAAFVGCTYHCG